MGRKASIPGPYDSEATADRRVVIAKVGQEDGKLVFDSCGGGFFGLQQYLMGHVIHKLAAKIRKDKKTTYDPSNIEYLCKLIRNVNFDGGGRADRVDNGKAGARDGRRRTGQVRGGLSETAGKPSDTPRGTGKGVG